MNNLNLLEVYKFDTKLRLGDLGDGGYVIGDIGSKYDCYISAGINQEESFSRDFINKYNMNEYNCFGYDNTIHSYPYGYTKKISFIKKNINSFNNDDNTNLRVLIEKYDNIFLKMDIEGGEYPWLLALDSSHLQKFKQIVIEFHGINDDTWGCVYDDKIKCLEKLAQTHYIIHAHGNNNAGVEKGVPNVLELTYINKNVFDSKPEANDVPFPIENLDYRNVGFIDEIQLNAYPFVKA